MYNKVDGLIGFSLSSPTRHLYRWLNRSSKEEEEATWDREDWTAESAKLWRPSSNLNQRNIIEIAKKYHRNVKEIPKKYQRNIIEIS